MSKWPNLKKAPITEALIDLRVRLPEGSTLETLGAFRDAVKESYPNCRERRKWHTRFTLHKEEPPTVETESEGPDGYILTSADGTQVVQARLDGFTFSRLKPYKDWEHLRENTRALWKTYCDVASPLMITRIAVRYINRIELPLPFEDFREWILTQPELAPGLPQRLAGFFFRVSLPFEELRGVAQVTQAIEPGAYEKSVPLIFDIDAFSQVELAPDSVETWERFEGLREIKNNVFFKSLTERTLEMYR